MMRSRLLARTGLAGFAAAATFAATASSLAAQARAQNNQGLRRTHLTPDQRATIHQRAARLG